MEPVLIIIRGNSGSGKTVLAEKIQQYLGNENCLLLHQDMLRRELLHATDQAGTVLIPLIDSLGHFAYDHYPVTILEGILRRDVYAPVLLKLIRNTYKKSLVYYIELPFETTVTFDQLKENSFGERNLRTWWQEADYLTEQDYLLKKGNTDFFFQKVIIDLEGLTHNCE